MYRARGFVRASTLQSITIRWPLFVATMNVAVAQQPLKVGGGPPQFPADPRIMITDSEIQARLTQIRADVAAGRMYSGEPFVLERAIPRDFGVAEYAANCYQRT